MKATMPTMFNFSHLSNASYSTQAHQNTVLPIAPIPSNIVHLSPYKDGHDPNCRVHNPTYHFILPD